MRLASDVGLRHFYLHEIQRIKELQSISLEYVFILLAIHFHSPDTLHLLFSRQRQHPHKSWYCSPCSASTRRAGFPFEPHTLHRSPDRSLITPSSILSRPKSTEEERRRTIHPARLYTKDKAPDKKNDRDLVTRKRASCLPPYRTTKLIS